MELRFRIGVLAAGGSVTNDDLETVLRHPASGSDDQVAAVRGGRPQ
jgi:hypothetical protein